MRFCFHSMDLSVAIPVMAVALALLVTTSEEGQLQRSKDRRQKLVKQDSTLDCHLREYTYRFVKKDEATGKSCSGYITVMSCWGRCNSGEMADYRFPYKKSFHYVCTHGDKKLVNFELSHCDPGAPSYLRFHEVPVPLDCACRYCDTSTTNCESFPSYY